MSGLEALFKAPLTWMIFGAAGQLALAARPERWLRFLLYLWALFALIVVGVMRFPYGDFSARTSRCSRTTPSRCAR